MWGEKRRREKSVVAPKLLFEEVEGQEKKLWEKSVEIPSLIFINR